MPGSETPSRTCGERSRTSSACDVVEGGKTCSEKVSFALPIIFLFTSVLPLAIFLVKSKARPSSASSGPFGERPSKKCHLSGSMEEGEMDSVTSGSRESRIKECARNFASYGVDPASSALEALAAKTQELLEIIEKPDVTPQKVEAAVNALGPLLQGLQARLRMAHHYERQLWNLVHLTGESPMR